MPETYIDCPELAGKTIRLLRIHRDTGGGTNVQIELTDGICFVCYVAVRLVVEASYYKGGVGSPRLSAPTSCSQERSADVLHYSHEEWRHS